jgi:hypothetical protein
MLNVRYHVKNSVIGDLMPTILISDSTSSIMVILGDIIDEWTDMHRKGKIIIHMDGAGPKRVEFNYSVEI